MSSSKRCEGLGADVVFDALGVAHGGTFLDTDCQEEPVHNFVAVAGAGGKPSAGGCQ